MARLGRLEKYLEILHNSIPYLAKEFQVATLEVFGSYVRREQLRDSDLDVLVTFSKPPSLLKFIRLENYLSDRLRVRVDLVMKDSLKPHIGKEILREAINV